nr:hypothetical protein [Providencia sp.]UNJ80232.1 hypothetical protein [Providencia sp.]
MEGSDDRHARVRDFSVTASLLISIDDNIKANYKYSDY